MTISQIKKSFGGRLVGSEATRNLVALAVSKLSEDQIDYITHHVWILSSHPQSWAFAFHGNDLKNKHLIFLSDELLSESKAQILFTILHELGHVLLGHHNSIDYKQPAHEINKQESEADLFAKDHLIW